MYGLDINFLNDRPELKPEAAARSKTVSTSPDSKTPLYLGVAALVIFPALALGAWLFLNNQNTQLNQRVAELDGQIATLKNQLGEIDSVRAQTKQITDETAAYVTVFNRIKPWSAMAQDIRDRLPAGIQLASIKQVAPPAGAVAAPSPSPTPKPGASPPPAPPPPIFIEIAGVANSFDAINDFLLVLQRSSFVEADQTRLVQATQGAPRPLRSISIPGVQTGTTGSQQLPDLPPVVEFVIRTRLNEVPTSELLRELERKGAVGVVTRIETLQQKGVVPPTK